MEHVVFFTAGDGASLFRRTPSLEDAARVVEHLRNAEGVEDFGVFALTPVPLAVRTYYRVELPTDDAPAEQPATAEVAEPVAEVPAYEARVEEPVADEPVSAHVATVAEGAAMPEFEPLSQMSPVLTSVPSEPLSEMSVPDAPEVPAAPSNGRGPRGLGFFNH